MSFPQRQEVRPRPAVLAVVMLGCVVFVAAGVWMLSDGGGIDVIVGVVAIAFFGGGAIYMIVTAARHGLSRLALTPTGLEVTGGGTVPWADIDEVAVVRKPAHMVTIRLRAYDRYVAGDPRRANKLRRTRHTFGYDLAFSPAWLDRPAPEFVRLLETYRHTCG